MITGAALLHRLGRGVALILYYALEVHTLIFHVCYRHPEPYLWKLDRTENFSRMRMKLSRNYDYNTHVDASRLRDVGSTPIPEPQQADASLLLAKVRCYLHLQATCRKEGWILYPQPLCLHAVLTTCTASKLSIPLASC